MVVRSAVRRGFRRRPKPRYEWLPAALTVPQSVAVGVIGSNALVVQSTFEEMPQCTILRVRGSIAINPATAPAAASGYGVYVGIFMRTTQENVWDPETMIEFPWMWHQAVYPQLGGTGAADQNASRWAGYFHLGFDVRSKRRTHEVNELILAVKNSASSAAAIQFSFVARTLVLVGH